MIKTRLRRKKEEDSLRPLTEKEIRQKLYGSYFQSPSVLNLNEEGEKEFIAPIRKDKNLFSRPSKKVSISFPKLSLRFPWREILSIFLKGIRAVFNFSKTSLAKATTGWGISILVVAGLFLGIHALNVYRAGAMKNPHPPRVRTEAPRKRVHHNPTPLTSPEASPPAAEEPALKPPTPAPEPLARAVRGAPPTPPVPVKPYYVIQVCTYTREEDARALVGQMNTANLLAFFQPLQRANGKTFYPVFLGRFATFREAQAKLKEFREKPIAGNFPDSFVRSL